MKRSAAIVAAGIAAGLAALVIWIEAAVPAPPTGFAIGSNGMPTLTGHLNGTVVGATGEGQTLSVTINFGEVSPANPNPMVRAVVPIGLRSSSSYQVALTVSGAISGDPYAVQLSDVGFGLQNFRPLGKFATQCGASSVITWPFENDPAGNVNLSGRASYTTALSNVGSSSVLIQGPKLSTKHIHNRKQNGYGVDVILTMVPQFYSVGTFSVTLSFTISAGPALPCSG